VTTEIYKSFRIEAAHFLPGVPEDHKCRRLHGHSFEIIVYVSGDVDEGAGWVQDFADISSAFQPIHDLLDHSLLNDTPGLENPTSELLAAWLWHQLIEPLPLLSRVVVAETCTSGCSYSSSS
jgi:6-pyruvoyltetrahydropterin/6-carboxytetrahydropterin synthase